MAETSTGLSRRQWNAAVLAGLATAAGSHSLRAESANANDWIDAHVHVWTPDTKAYPLDSHFTKQAMQPPSFTPEELFAVCKPAGVSRVVLIQMSF